jgi:hypothetical protein
VSKALKSDGFDIENASRKPPMTMIQKVTCDMYILAIFLHPKMGEN